MSLSARAQFTPRNDLGRFVEAYITPGVIASVQAACQLIQERAQEIVPVDTGALRESITTEIDTGGKTVVGSVAPQVPYAMYVEFGTGQRGAASPGSGPGPYNPTWPGMPAQPYMRPALDESRGAVKDLFRSNISLGI